MYPAWQHIYRAFNLCPFRNVKVVILGQDPYHGEGQAHGLSFSVPNGIRPPPSLMNMYKELAQEFPEDVCDEQGNVTDKKFVMPKHGCLEKWAKEGVLLLNTGLTVQASKAGSHRHVAWKDFTAAVLRTLSKTSKKSIVFMLWGNHAKEQKRHIFEKKKTEHWIVEGVHPSPLSASRGWFGCNHFKRANAYLRSKGRTGVDWTL